MKVEELITKCMESMAHPEYSPGGIPVVVLVVPNKKWKWQRSIRLCGKSGPLGSPVGSNDYGIIAFFKAEEVLKFITKQIEATK